MGASVSGELDGSLAVMADGSGTRGGGASDNGSSREGGGKSVVVAVIEAEMMTRKVGITRRVVRVLAMIPLDTMSRLQALFSGADSMLDVGKTAHHILQKPFFPPAAILVRINSLCRQRWLFSGGLWGWC